MTQYLEHTTGPNERWDHLAYRYYGDANRTSPIIRENRNLFIGSLGPIPTVLPVGLELRIPIVERESIAETLLPPWKRAAP